MKAIDIDKEEDEQVVDNSELKKQKLV